MRAGLEKTAAPRRGGAGALAFPKIFQSSGAGRSAQERPRHHPSHFPAMKTRTTLVIAILTALQLLAPAARCAAAPAPSPAVATAIAQLREFYLGPASGIAMQTANEPLPDPSRAFTYLATLRPDGTWPDIDYADTARSGWRPAIHFERIMAMTLAAMRADSVVTAAQRAQLLDAIHRAFAHWIQHHYQCTNWWYNDIGTPKTLGLAGLLLGDQLNDAERAYLTGKLLTRPVGMTGQNRVWLAGNALYRALLRADESALAKNSAIIWAELRVSTDEGVQPDNSFHQHGAQLQFGNYGLSFAVENCRWGLFLRGTPWAMPPEKLAIYRDYLLEGLNWTCWRGAMDIGACGRQFMPGQPRIKAANISRVMQQSTLIDPARAAAYNAFIARNKPETRATLPPDDLTGNKYFWRSDYMVHRTPQFMAALKMSSRRVVGAELVNSENLSGYRIADGALYLYRTTSEYADIFPVWDWRKLPGITAPQTPLPDYKHSQLDSDLVGAATDGTHAVAMLRYARKGENLTANKAYFFCGDEILCLGAGITGQSDAGIATAINQCHLVGAPVVMKNEDVIDHIEHDGWRYTLLDTGGATVRLETAPVTGNWSKVFRNPETPKADVTLPIFNLWLDHGRAPANATYAYALTPAGSAPAAKVLQNTPALQIVQMTPTLHGIIFWKPGAAKISADCTLTADHPCLVLLDTAARTLHVAEPTQKLPRLALTCNGKPLEVPLPAGAQAGSTTKVPLP